MAENLRREQTLEQRERELTDALRIAGIGMWRYECATAITTWSDQIYRIYGLEPGSPVEEYADCLRNASGPDGDRSFVQAFERAIQLGEPYSLDLAITRADGSRGWILARGEVDRWVDGKVAALRGTVHDITDRKLAEEEGRIANQRLKNVLDSFTDGLCVLDRDLTYVYFNENGARMVGLRPEDIIGTRVGDTFAENKTNLIWSTYRRALDTGEPIHVEEYSFAPLNKWFESNCYPSADGLTVYFRDITSRKRTENELREREQQFRLLAESLPTLVWVSDARGALTYLNSRFLSYCGIAPEAMVGFNWQLILEPGEMERVNLAWSHSVSTGEPYSIELQLRGSDGSFRHFLARALALRNPAGEVEQWVGTCTDVHDVRLAEEALRRSEKLAATGRLAASIAHEINNPLAAVTNALYLALQDKGLPAETRGYLETADQELARVSQITTQTLRFHRQSKSKVVADLSEIMGSVLTLFSRRFLGRQIVIDSECQDGARLLCFEDEIRQVFANLISNALDATPDGGKVRIRIRRNGMGVRVTVADTGCGIPARIQERIFEPFFSTKDATGIGLGLWVSEGILRKHNARIRFRSRTEPCGPGTVFCIQFTPGDPARTQPAV